MSAAVLLILPSLGILLAVLIATAPLGLPVGASYLLQLLPYMIAHVFIARGKGLVASPVLFVAGIVMDVATDGPLGFWALIYLFGVLIARQLPSGLLETYLGRLSGLLLVVFALTVIQVGVASLYQLRWIDWYVVLAGTLGAGAVAFAIDLLWREGRVGNGLDVTTRGGGREGRHV